ncbi:MAG: HDIG domain-containing protein [Spirochaetes bacterium]|nr:HDIG domain-containing protein [Spirochaetota bacterium]
MKTIERIKVFLRTSFFLYLVLSIILFFFFLISFTFKDYSFKYNYRIGDIAQSDIIVKKDINYIDEPATSKKYDEGINNILPSYIVETKYVNQTINKWVDIINFVSKNGDRLIEQKSLYQIFPENPNISNETKKFLFLLKKEENFNKFKYFIEKVYTSGFSNKKFSEFSTSKDGFLKINIITENQSIIKTENISNILYSENHEKKLVEMFLNYFQNFNFKEASLIVKDIKQVFIENIKFDATQYYKDVENFKKNFSPVYVTMKKGKVILRKGEEITLSDLEMLKIYYQFHEKIDITYILFLSLCYFIFIFISYFLINEVSHKFFKKRKNILFIFFIYSLLFIFILFSKYISYSLNIEKYLLFPFALINSLFVFIFPVKIAITLNLSFSLIYFLVSDFEFTGFIFSILLNSIFVIFKQDNLKVKQAIFYRSLYTLIFSTIFGLFLNFLNRSNNFNIKNLILFSFINSSLSGIFFLGLMPLIEFLFNYATPYKLIELSDLNHKIFNELLVKAPGTYHHSIIVANLAQNAAIACGANPYIAKVGGLYHDIGKIKYSKYFIENQNTIYDMQDKLSNPLNTSMALTIIKNHVKYGIEEAKRLKLPDEIISIIEEHHGKTLMVYFYNLELQKNKELKKEDFCYDYPKPTSKESVIVMLADSVEAATRTLTNVTYNSVEKMVKEIVNDRFLSGQLSESPITLHDLNLIEKSLIENILAMFHKRIDYPDSENVRILEKKIKSEKYAKRR